MINNVSFKKKTFSSLFIFILLNIFILMSFISFIFIPNFLGVNNTASEHIRDQINHIENNLNEKRQIHDFLTQLSQNNNVEIILRNQNNEIIFDNTHHRTTFLSISELITIENEVFLLTVKNFEHISGGALLINFLLFQTFVLLILYIPFLFLSDVKVLTPISNIIKDIRDYKFGIKPSKRDVTKGMDINKIQNEFVDLVETIEDEKAKQTRIIASISHDIKTPLTTIMGYTDRLKTINLNKEDRKKYINKIYDKSLIMKEIIEGFDDYLSHNIDSELKTEITTTSKLLEEIKNNFSDDLKDKGIKLQINQNELVENIDVDVSKMQRVFSNIINNSVRHINKKGVITITLEKTDCDLIFKINDNGGGIKENIKEQIFEPLFTTDKSRTISGLGLSICKEIINMHNGSIRAYNEDQGLTIEFILPIYFEEDKL